MKKLLSILLAVMMIFALCACSTSPSNSADVESSKPSSDATGEDASSDNSFEGETLVVGVWGGTIEQVLRDHVVTPMEEELGCSIELVLGGTGDRVAKLYTEKDNPSMDVFGLNVKEAMQAIENGVAAEVNPNIENFDQLYDFAQEGGYGQSLMALGICYNNEVVTEPITDWKDLWRPELKGKVSLSTFPGSETSGFLTITAKVWGLDLANDPEAVFKKVGELGPFPLFFTNLDELFLEMKSGNILASVIFNSYANDFIDQGFPCEFVYPNDPGALLAKDTWVIAKNSKHIELAEEFISRCISVEVQKAYAEEIYFSPCNKEVEITDEALKSKLVYGEDAAKLEDTDWDTITANEEAFTEMWNRLVIAAE